MGIKVGRRDIVWNYIGIFFSMGANFILLPFMLIFLNSDSIGLWYVYLSIGGVASLFDFGFNPTFARNMAYCWSGAKELQQDNVEHILDSGPNYLQMSVLIKTSKAIYFIIALVSLSLLTIFGSLYILRISASLDKTEVICSWIVYIFAVFLNLYYGYYASFLRGIGAIATYNRINVWARVLQIVIASILMAMRIGIIAVSFAYLSYAILIRIFSKRAFWKYENIKSGVSRYERDITWNQVIHMFKTIWHNAWRDGLVTVARYVSNQMGTLVASMFLSLAETGAYSLTVQLITAILTIGGGIYSAIQPEWQSAYVVNDRDTLRKDTGIVMSMYCYVSFIGIFVLFLFGPPIIALLKPEMIIDRMMILGLAFYLYFYTRTAYYASFLSNMNTVPYAFAFIISGLAGVFISYLLIRYSTLGIWGIVIGQVIPQILFNFWKWPSIVLKYLDLNVLDVIIIGTEEIKNKVGSIFGKQHESARGE